DALTRAKRQDRLLLSGLAAAGCAAALVVLAILVRK
ncbi:MAG: hypothetical protein JWN02_1587, partial [Acidobacteria bacterium]|nr:hypothetical protein [Acidobacteriota bacterium]